MNDKNFNSDDSTKLAIGNKNVLKFEFIIKLFSLVLIILGILMIWFAIHYTFNPDNIHINKLWNGNLYTYILF
ncbi:hypothetical protein SCORR_v1c05770 [Spiroplasma corruscae]|uniref:Uncharacterized protein n=1 Tax=Spiroplasma corruscae TaxID=216934 RepID=A0A222EPA8_9MOLU|nr:hypothetical protein [Spiroplasma corruscae]ASP28349.1 hypothetical protein SCORR_v1c05770 [Spiroplasma corruscae]